MTQRSPEYQRNARTIRARTRAQLKFGHPVPCWRCGQAIMPGMPFDVGHIDPRGGDRMTNLSPEHRHATGNCRGNRAHGGSDGAAITNGRRINHRALDVQSWPL
jgi:hypothetical protein